MPGVVVGVELPAVEVVGEFFEQFGAVVVQLSAEQDAAFKGVFAQHLLTEAVDGRDRRGVEVEERGAQPFPALFRSQRFKGASDELRFAPRFGRQSLFECGERAGEHLPDAAGEFGRRGAGVGDHQQFFNRDIPLQHRAHHEVLDVVGLAGPGGRFDQEEAPERAVQRIKLLYRRHCRTSCGCLG